MRDGIDHEHDHSVAFDELLGFRMRATGFKFYAAESPLHVGSGGRMTTMVVFFIIFLTIILYG